MGVNVRGAFIATREAAARMRTDRGGSGGAIVNVSSRASELGGAGEWVHYAASKGAVDTLTLGLAKELGPRKIRVNSINPGVVDTEGARAFGFIGSDLQLSLENLTPLGRYGEPSDIAPIATFLASDDSRWLTGEHLVASGGLR